MQQDDGCWRNFPFLKVPMPCLLLTDDLRQGTCGGARETPSGSISQGTVFLVQFWFI